MHSPNKTLCYAIDAMMPITSIVWYALLRTFRTPHSRKSLEISGCARAVVMKLNRRTISSDNFHRSVVAAGMNWSWRSTHSSGTWIYLVNRPPNSSLCSKRETLGFHVDIVATIFTSTASANESIQSTARNVSWSFERKGPRVMQNTWSLYEDRRHTRRAFFELMNWWRRHTTTSQRLMMPIDWS